MTYLWILGTVFILVNLAICVSLLAYRIESKSGRSSDKKDQAEEPLFNLPVSEVVVIIFIWSFMFNLTIPAMNHAAIIVRGATQDELTFPGYVPFDPHNGWHKKEEVIYLIVSGISVSLFGALYVWLIRCLLPEKYKSCITWKKRKRE